MRGDRRPSPPAARGKPNGNNMLTLRPEQLEAFEEHLFDQMQVRLERAIAGTFPEFAIASASAGDGARVDVPSAEAKGLVERGISSAAEFDIFASADIAAFIAVGVALRAGGSSAPVPEWISDWLNRPDTPGATKMALIEAH